MTTFALQVQKLENARDFFRCNIHNSNSLTCCNNLFSGLEIIESLNLRVDHAYFIFNGKFNPMDSVLKRDCRITFNFFFFL